MIFTRLCYIMRLQLSVNDYGYKKKKLFEIVAFWKKQQIVWIYWDSSQSSVYTEDTDTVYLSYQVTKYIASLSKIMCTIKKTFKQLQWKFFHFCKRIR